jgi:CRP/FNR family cyclic AMP-dependent transcriptional regulator
MDDARLRDRREPPAAWPVAGSFLAAVDAGVRDALLEAGVRRRFAAHSVLFHRGDPSTHVVFLLAGWVKVSSTSRDGYEALLAIRGPGDVVGDLAAVDGRPRSATVVTLGQVEASVLAAERFVESLGRQPRLALALLGYQADRLRDADSRRLEFGALSVTERLARRLLALADSHGSFEPDGIVIGIPLSQRELAGSIGASREAVARILRILRERHIVTTHRQRIVIARPQVLRSIGGTENIDT